MWFFEAIVGDSTALFFALVIFSVFALALLTRFWERFQRVRGLDSSGPTLLTTLGVLGTFVGIALGLLDFDVKNIDESVPQLLAGLKVAFLTSILGLAASITLKGVQTITPKLETEEAEVTPEVIHTALKSIREGIDKASSQESESLEDLRKAVSADSDSSLLTQIQKLRTDFKDGQQELTKEFRQFAETMAENNSKALIEALEQVIRDFNTQLNEQFGENFKQLNEAVGALLTWQDNYRKHVEELERRLEAAVQATEASEQALREIAGHTGQIPETLQSLRDILKGLDEHLTTVAGLRDKAIEAFPVIDDNLTKLTNRLEESVQQAIQRSDNALQRQQDAHSKLHQGFDQLLENAQQAQQQFENSFTTLTDRLTESVGQTLQRADTALQRQQETYQRQQDTYQQLHAGFEQLLTNAQQAQQQFENSFTTLTDRLTESVEQTLQRADTALQRQQETYQRQQDAYQQLHRNFDQLSTNAQQAQQRFESVFNEALSKASELTNRLTESVGQTLQRADTALQRQQETYQRQQDAYQQLHTSFDQLFTSAYQSQQRFESAFNETLSKASELTSKFAESVGQAIQRSDDALRHQQDAYQRLHTGFDQLLTNANQSQQRFESAFNEALSKAFKRIEPQLENLNREMERTLHQSIETMGGHLASLSEKFVEDYSPLTDKLRRVVRMANGLDRQ